MVNPTIIGGDSKATTNDLGEVANDMLSTFCVHSEDFLLICFRITPRIIVGLTTIARVLQN